MSLVPVSLRTMLSATSTPPCPEPRAQSPPPPLPEPSVVPSPLKATVYWHRLVRDQSPQPFVEYRIDCSFGDQDWRTWRRFSEFAALRDSLRPDFAAACVQLPSKSFARHATSDLVAGQRAAALSAWLGGVLNELAALESPTLLAFLGLVSIEPANRGRQALHVRLIDRTAETGDLVLFRTRATVPALQRVVTRSKWDHVGILIFRTRRRIICSAAEAAEDGDAGVIESDANGTRFYPLAMYEARWHHAYEQIAVRQLLWPGRGSPQSIAILSKWVDSVVGKPYELTIGKVVSRARVESQPARTAPPSTANAAACTASSATSARIAVTSTRAPPPLVIGFSGAAPAAEAAPAANQSTVRAAALLGSSAEAELQRNRGFFCSELAAHAYKTLGVPTPMRLERRLLAPTPR